MCGFVFVYVYYFVISLCVCVCVSCVLCAYEDANVAMALGAGVVDIFTSIYQEWDETKPTEQPEDVRDSKKGEIQIGEREIEGLNVSFHVREDLNTPLVMRR